MLPLLRLLLYRLDFGYLSNKKPCLLLLVVWLFAAKSYYDVGFQMKLPTIGGFLAKSIYFLSRALVLAVKKA